MQLNLFNGGLSIRLAQHLIQQNQAVECENIDFNSGVLKPQKADLVTNTKADSSMYYFNNHWIFSSDSRDYVEFQEKLYYSVANGKAQKSNDGFVFYNLGIEKPEGITYKISSNDRVVSTTKLVKYADKLNIGFRSKNNYEDLSGQGAHSVLTYSPSYWDGSKISMEVILKRSGATQFSYGKYTPDMIDRLKGDTNFVVCGLDFHTSSPSWSGEVFIKIVGVDDDFYEYNASQGMSDASVVNVICPSGKTNITLTDKYPNYKNNILILDEEKNITILVNESSPKYENIVLETLDYYYITELQKIEFTLINEEKTYIKVLTQDENEKYKTINYTKESDYKIYITNLVPVANWTNLSFYITFYNSSDGTESPPSDVIEVINLLPVEFTISDIPDPQVDTIRVYGIVGGYSEPVLIKQSPVTQNKITISYAETQDLASQLLDSYNNYPPEVGLTYLTQANAMLLGAKDFNLYYSSIGQPNYWSPYDFIAFNATITGIGVTQNGILVFTSSQTYIITGNSAETYSKFLLDGSQGCISHKSIKSYENNLIWVSNDSLLMSNGGIIQNVSREQLGKLSISNVYDAAISNDIYYLSTSQNTLIADMRNGLAYLYSKDAYIGMHYNRHNDSLYACLFDKTMVIVEGDSDNVKTFTYKSPKFPSGSISSVKNYKTFYVNSTGNLTIDIIIDDVVLTSATLNGGIEEVRIPNDSRLGYYVQFKVTGTGTLNEIEFKQEDRQNGR